MSWMLISEAEGFRYRDYGKGIVVYEFDEHRATNTDKLAFAFMSWFPNGTLVRIDSADTRDFIDIKLVKILLVVKMLLYQKSEISLLNPFINYIEYSLIYIYKHMGEGDIC